MALAIEGACGRPEFHAARNDDRVTHSMPVTSAVGAVVGCGDVQLARGAVGGVAVEATVRRCTPAAAILPVPSQFAPRAVIQPGDEIGHAQRETQRHCQPTKSPGMTRIKARKAAICSFTAVPLEGALAFSELQRLPAAERRLIVNRGHEHGTGWRNRSSDTVI